ncbi:MAG: cysteine synthase A [Pleomorphochaeta sp.]
MLIENITKAIGDTPLIKINKLNNTNNNIYVKFESMNPLSSIKDRAALYMIEEAEKKGILKPNSVIIEPTSGNTGIGLAYISVVKGYKCKLVMPESMSIERRKLLKALGAEIVLTDAKKGMSGAIEKANELAKTIDNSFIPGQFDNPDNALAHYETTAREIYKDLDSKVDIFVSAVGSAGTIMGCAKYFKEQNNQIKIVAVEPYSSAVLSKEKAGSHKIQGIGAGFIPSIYDERLVDEVVKIKDEDAINFSKRLSREEALLVGISSGAAFAGALEVAKTVQNKNIVVILPDSGERYLSTELFED